MFGQNLSFLTLYVVLKTTEIIPKLSAKIKLDGKLIKLRGKQSLCFTTRQRCEDFSHNSSRRKSLALTSSVQEKDAHCPKSIRESIVQFRQNVHSRTTRSYIDNTMWVSNEIQCVLSLTKSYKKKRKTSSLPTFGPTGSEITRQDVAGGISPRFRLIVICSSKHSFWVTSDAVKTTRSQSFCLVVFNESIVEKAM